MRSSREFQRVFRSGRSFPGRLIVLHVLTEPGLVRRAGFVAGRKVGGAVRRNRAKRLLREAYRCQKHRVPPLGVHLILVARTSCAGAGERDVESELIVLLDRADVAAGPDPRNETDDDHNA